MTQFSLLLIIASIWLKRRTGTKNDLNKILFVNAYICRIISFIFITLIRNIFFYNDFLLKPHVDNCCSSGVCTAVYFHAKKIRDTPPSHFRPYSSTSPSPRRQTQPMLGLAWALDRHAVIVASHLQITFKLLVKWFDVHDGISDKGRVFVVFSRGRMLKAPLFLC